MMLTMSGGVTYVRVGEKTASAIVDKNSTKCQIARRIIQCYFRIYPEPSDEIKILFLFLSLRKSVCCRLTSVDLTRDLVAM